MRKKIGNALAKARRRRKWTQSELARRLETSREPERVQEWLAAHPGWSLDPTGTVLNSIRTFPSETAAAHFASFVSGLASSAELQAMQKVIGCSVHISLYSPQEEQGPGPLTENVLTLASHVG